jgi:selenocysteine lyase/cysteine desulfurase
MSHDLFADFRSNFPGTRDGIFTNVAQRGLMPVQVRDAITAYLDRRTGVGWSKEESFDCVEGTRVTFAKMVNADPDEIAFVKNVSDGLNHIAGGMSWQAGDNMILCPELEHPANVYPWYNAARRYGIEVRTVPPDDGRINLDTLMAAVDERTRVVSVSTVTFSPGFVTDIPALSAACGERGVRVVVDAAQSVGILHTDVEQLGVDALAVATQKGLLACYGMGFLYCRKDFAEELEPAALARFSVAYDEGAHETALTGENFTYAAAARRFDGGNYNYLGITAVKAALDLLNQLGTPAIDTYVRELAARMAEGFLEAGLPVCGGSPGPHLGNIVALGESGSGRHYTADDPAMNTLHDALTQGGVHLSIRKGILRFSLHAYNNEEDVDRVLEIARGGRGPALVQPHET